MKKHADTGIDNAKKTVHVVDTHHAPAESHSSHNNMIISIAAIIGIVIITYLAINSVLGHAAASSQQAVGTNSAGQAFVAVNIERVCNVLVSDTTVFDTGAISSLMITGDQAFYEGHYITLTGTTSSGCIISVDNNSDFISVGQIERLGGVYVLVKGINQH